MGLPRVRHAELGEGRVRAWRRGRRVAIVDFVTEPLPVSVPMRDLELLDEATGAPSSALPDSLAGASHLEGSFDGTRAGLTLEAMRLGVVPSASLDAYTVGREKELALIDADLDTVAEAGGAVRAFLGDYGVGKTHLLELVQQRALARQFLATRVVLDAREIPPSHPKRVYRSLVRGLRYPDRPFEEGSGLAPLLDTVAALPAALATFGLGPDGGRGTLDERLAAGKHLYLSAALAYWAGLPVEAERERELVLDWLEGHPTVSNQHIDRVVGRLLGRATGQSAARRPKVYSLLDYRPWARIYGYLLSGLAAMARRAGLGGLVVLVDEAEFYTLLGKENRGFARTVFRALAAATGAVDPAPEDAELLGGGYGVQRRLPVRYGDSPGLYVVFAMTPHAEGVDALQEAVPDGQVATLGALSASDYETLVSRVCDFYASAQRDWKLPASLIGPLTRVTRGLVASGQISSPRHAMKFVIEFLDVVRFHPDRVLGMVRNLQDTVLF